VQHVNTRQFIAMISRNCVMTMMTLRLTKLPYCAYTKLILTENFTCVYICYVHACIFRRILQRVHSLLGSDRKQTVPTAKNQHAATEELFEVVFSVVRAAAGATQRRCKHVSAARGYKRNTSTVTLRVVGGDEMGSLKSDRPVLSSERGPHKNKTVTFKQ
jgi:hypothetical protein